MSRTTTLGLSVAVLLLAALGVVAGIALSRTGEALPGVTVDGVDVGGLGPEDLREQLGPVAASRTVTPVTVLFQDETFTVDPAEVGVRLDVDDLVDRVLSAGREGRGPDRWLAELRGGQAEVPLDVEVDPAAVTARVEEIAAAVDQDREDGNVQVDPATLEVRTVLPAEGVETDVAASSELVLAALTSGSTEPVDLVATVTPSPVPTEDVEAVARQAERAVAAPLVLTGNGAELELDRRDVARLVSSRVVGPEDARTLELAVRPANAAGVLGAQVDTILTTPVDARFVTPDRTPVQFDDQDDATWRPRRDVGVEVRPGTTGTAFDAQLAAEQLEVVLAAGERRAELRLAPLEPDLTTSEAEAFGVDDLLSTFTTYHACCATRVTNIQRLADTVDGTVVMPGEQFSVNQLSGVRRCEDGYAAAGMILNGEIVDVCGGGVSQFGTTSVNAVFFSGIDPDAYKPHSFYISRYPMAREATLNYPSPDIDVRFTNETGAPVIVRTQYTGTSITVSFYGNADDLTEVRADHGGTFNPRPYRTIRRENRSLPPGAETRVQSGSNGFSVRVTRDVVRPGGTTSDDWSNTYVARNEIIEFNPAPPRRPGPPPEPTTEDG